MRAHAHFSDPVWELFGRSCLELLVEGALACAEICTCWILFERFGSSVWALLVFLQLWCVLVGACVSFLTRTQQSAIFLSTEVEYHTLRWLTGFKEAIFLRHVWSLNSPDDVSGTLEKTINKDNKGGKQLSQPGHKTTPSAYTSVTTLSASGWRASS